MLAAADDMRMAASSTQAIFHLTEPAISRQLRRVVALLLIAGLAGGVLALTLQSRHERLGLVHLGSVAVVYLVLGFVVQGALRVQRTALRSYVIALGPSSIRRERVGVATVEIDFGSIREILEDPNGLTVRGEGRGEVIRIVAGTGRFAELRSRLAEVRPIEAAPRRASPVVAVLVVLATLSAYSIVLLARSRWLVIGLGAMILVLGLWALVGVWRDPSLDERVRRSAPWGLLAMLPILARVAQALASR